MNFSGNEVIRQVLPILANLADGRIIDAPFNSLSYTATDYGSSSSFGIRTSYDKLLHLSYGLGNWVLGLGDFPSKDLGYGRGWVFGQHIAGVLLDDMSFSNDEVVNKFQHALQSTVDLRHHFYLANEGGLIMTHSRSPFLEPLRRFTCSVRSRLGGSLVDPQIEIFNESQRFCGFKYDGQSVQELAELTLEVIKVCPELHAKPPEDINSIRLRHGGSGFVY